MQFLAGAVVFLLPNVALHWRQQLSPVHQFLGRALFSAALQIFLALTGLLVLSHHAVPVNRKGEEDPALLEPPSA